jgi:spore coat polysaccharide biosynthesis predicted glycosyltransferase SpsG/ribosomal protein S18 acetylase RimI-like enzyme
VASALGCRIAAIDDLGDRPLDVDVLVDHNHADHARKYAGRLREGARLLVGPRFALLAPPYATAPRHVPRDRVESIGVFMGGTDPAATSALVLRACRQEAGFAGRIEVATTLANPRLAELAAAVDRDAATTLTIDAPDLAGFFARHDLQVGAGGGATWERCCLGAPTVLLITAPNQYAVVPALVDLGAVVSPEPLGTLDAVAIGRAVAAVIDEPARRRQLAARSLDLVDGRGAQRVALALNASALRVRPATAEDSALAHVWRNHEATRRMSVDPAAIDEAGHQQWWQACLVAGDRRLLIGLVGDVPIGVTRVDRQANGAAVVSLYLDPALHGLGLGTALLRAGEEAWCAQAGREVTFEATVLDTNAASKRLFAAAGYIQHAPQRWRKALAIVSARTTP